MRHAHLFVTPCEPLDGRSRMDRRDTLIAGKLTISIPHCPALPENLDRRAVLVDCCAPTCARGAVSAGQGVGLVLGESAGVLLPGPLRPRLTVLTIRA